MLFMASSSSSSCCKYDVFLSFRGEDTRENFTSHLFKEMSERKKIRTFIDEGLRKGDEISPDLLNAVIEGSKISVIIFSKNYASSKWCLDELVKILECKKMNGQIVIPVFYHVHPSDVRKQTGSFGEAFAQHEKDFRKKPGKVQNWRDALTEASYLSGHESSKIRPEAKLVDVIVKDVLKKLEAITVSIDFHGLVGINSRIERVKSLLCIGLSDFRIVGIRGMGGIGKTTLAEAIFKQVSHDFEGKCFIANVREKSEKGGGLEHLQKEVLSYLLEENIEKGGPNLPQYTKERLKRMKIFIVLDDVNTLGQLKSLIGEFDQFGPGSRIIITTRNQKVLNEFRVDYIYEVEKLNDDEALELFCNYAFKQNYCPEDFMVLLGKIIHHAKGNALALTVLGSSFNGKSRCYWEKMLDDLPLVSKSEIYDVLKISYDGLNLDEKSIFLDVACFFNGEDKDHVLEILDDPSLCYGLNVLIDMSLITISKNKTLRMHDLLQDMGRDIVRQESIKNPEKRSRLWYHEDVYHVLEKNKGTDLIEGINLDLSKVRDMHLTSGAFAKMPNLRLLKFYMPNHFDFTDMHSKVHLPQGLDYLSDELRYLHWHGFPLRTLPINFSPGSLVELTLPYSKIQQLWEEKKEAFKLKSIDLQHCQCFTMIPNPSEIPNLERLNLLNCVKLSHIPSFIQHFSNLGTLCLKGCNSLKCFPRNVHFKSPITIDMSFCVDVTEFPQISGKILELNLGGTTIEEVLPSIEGLIDLEKLDLTFCEKLKAVSTSICKLKSLRDLSLDYCSMLEGFPEILEKMEHLESVGLKFTAIKELPSSIENLQGLKTLSLMDCSKLDSLPEDLGNLKSLKFIYGKRIAITQLPSSITNLNQLEQLSLSGCRGLVLPSLLGLSFLKILELDDCGIMEIPQDVGCLCSLESLNLKGNNFETLPTSMKQLCKLRELILRSCKNLQSLPELPLYPFFLDATNCKRLHSLPELPSPLQEVDASVLEKLSKQYTCDKDPISMELDFSNSPKLYGKTQDSQSRIYHMAIASLRQFCENEISIPYGVSICLPGRQIPNWFGYHNSGSLVNIQHHQFHCERNFIGFALCAVIAFGKTLGADEDFAVLSKYRFNTKTFSETKHVDRQFVFKTIKKYSFGDDLTSYPTHIYLGFDPCSIVGLCDAVSFEFFVDSVYKFEKGPKVEYCGVCPTYLYPVDTIQSLLGIKGGKFTTRQLTFSTTGLDTLETYQVWGCRGLVLTSLPSVASFLSSLIKLELDDCDIMEIPQDIDCLFSLECLNLKGNNFESLPTSIKQLSKLTRLILSNCNMLHSLPELPPHLLHLEAMNCKRLQFLPKLPSCPKELDASVLKKLSEPFCVDHINCEMSLFPIVELNFTNCMNLNKNTHEVILADSQLRIQHMAVASLRQLHEEGFFHFKGVTICLPGSRIPDWFSNQSLGSSIRIQLPELCCFKSVIGFAICAVIAFEEPFQPGWDFGVECKYYFKAKTCFLRRFRLKNTWMGRFDSDHVFLGFNPCFFNGYHHSFDSFYFYSTGVDDEVIKVKCCGVCPIYAHPIDAKPNTITVNMLAPTEEEFRKLHLKFHEETSTECGCRPAAE